MQIKLRFLGREEELTQLVQQEESWGTAVRTFKSVPEGNERIVYFFMQDHSRATEHDQGSCEMVNGEIRREVLGDRHVVYNRKHI